MFDFNLEHKIFKRLPNLGQVKYLGRVLTKKEKKIAFILLLVGFLSFLLLIGRIYFSKSEMKPTADGKYIEGLVGELKYINPILAVNDIDQALGRLIFSGLLKYDKNLELIPDLAEDLPIKHEQKKYTLCLKKNLFWHDGEKLTIDDIIFTYELAKNPIFKNPLLKRLKHVNVNVNVVKVDNYCLEFNLQKSSTAFLSDLTLGILPKHIWGNIDLDKFFQSEFNLKPVGSGPFKFVSLAKDNSDKIKFYILNENKKFHGKIPYIQEITFKFYSNFTDSIEALKTNQINGLGYSPKGVTEKLSEIINLKHYQFNLPYYTAIFFNLRAEDDKALFWQEKAVRVALAHLIPKQDIFTSVFNSEGIVIHGPTLPHSFAFNPDLKKYEFNPELAQKILIEADWKKNTKGFWEKNGERLEISLTTVDRPDFQQTVKLIQKSWQSIGIFVKLITISTEQVKEVIFNHNYQALLYGVLQGFNLDPYPIWHSSQSEPPGLNLTGFKHRRMDELLEKAALSDSQEIKREYYYEFQEILADNLPAIFLHNPTYSYLVDQKIKGIELDRLNRPEDRFIDIENWYIKTKRTLK